MPAIVRTLWGSELPLSRWAKIARTDIPRGLAHTRPPVWVYVYGKDNADLLTRLGCKNVVLVDDNPWPDGMYDCKRGPGNDFYHPWHYKWNLIARAMADHGEVIYCDWDVFCLEADVPAIFARLERFPEFALALNYYGRPQRLPKRPDPHDRRYCVGGFWLYLRTARLLTDVLARMDPDPAGMKWHDELVMSEMIDEWHGGWPGERVWLERYESPIMCAPIKRYPWPVVEYGPQYVTRQTPIPFRWERVFIHR